MSAVMKKGDRSEMIKTSMTGGKASSQNATLTLNGEQYELPVIEGSIGPKVIDVTSLYKETGHFTYDPGFMSTASCSSSITYIDGNKGELLHRGYAIDDLAKNCSFNEVAYMLLYGELPNEQQRKEFDAQIKQHTMVNEQLQHLFQGFPRSAHPMGMMASVVSALSVYYHDELDMRDEQQRDLAAIRLIAKVPTIAAMCYKHSVGLPFTYPDNSFRLWFKLFKNDVFCSSGRL